MSFVRVKALCRARFVLIAFNILALILRSVLRFGLQSATFRGPHVQDVVSVGFGRTAVDSVDKVVRLEGVVLVAHLDLVALGRFWGRRLDRSVHEEHRDEEQNRAEAVESGVEEHDGATVADGLGQGVDQDGQVATDVVHHEQEHADGGRADLQRDDFHQHGEHDSEPHFGCKREKKELDSKSLNSAETLGNSPKK